MSKRVQGTKKKSTRSKHSGSTGRRQKQVLKDNSKSTRKRGTSLVENFSAMPGISSLLGGKPGDWL